MAYVIGQAANLEDLRTAIVNACTANGWTLNADVLSKGGVFIEVVSDISIAEPPDHPPRLKFLGGLGIDGSDNLTTPGLSSVWIDEFAQPITYPATYEVHINTLPDEVYVIVNYSVDFYQWAGWGKSDVAGLPGAGVWYAASKGRGGAVPINPPEGNESGVELPYLFAWHSPAANFGGGFANSFIHHGVDGGAWNPANYTNVSGQDNQVIQPNAWKPALPLHMIQPNAWNDEPVLVPIQVWIVRAEGDKVSLVADLRHARYTRIDNHDPGDVITLGPDRWKIYPWYRKDPLERDGAHEAEHTGTFAWAVRYTGP